MSARRSLREVDALQQRISIALKPQAEALLRGANDNVAKPVAIAFKWRDPASLPKREWLYGRHLIRKFVSVKVAPGGVGKTSLTVAEGIAMASGKPILGEAPKSPLRVCLWNGEDPRDEIERRITAAMIRHEVRPEDIGDRLFIGSGRDRDLKIVREEARTVTISAPDVAAVKGFLALNRIDVLVIDPFVSTHAVSENDNGAIDRVAKQWAKIADEANCAIELVHHSRKTAGGEVTAQDSRGAVALIDAARSVQTLNRMSKDEAGKLGLEPTETAHLFRVDFGKTSMAPGGDGASWYRLASVQLGNGRGGNLDFGDSVGVVTLWRYPSNADVSAQVTTEQLDCIKARIAGGLYRASEQAKEWAGYIVAEVLGLDARGNRGDKRRVATLLKAWIAAGHFHVAQYRDPIRREQAPCLFVGAQPE